MHLWQSSTSVWDSIKLQNFHYSIKINLLEHMQVQEKKYYIYFF